VLESFACNVDVDWEYLLLMCGHVEMVLLGKLMKTQAEYKTAIIECVRKTQFSNNY